MYAEQLQNIRWQESKTKEVDRSSLAEPDIPFSIHFQFRSELMLKHVTDKVLVSMLARCWLNVNGYFVQNVSLLVVCLKYCREVYNKSYKVITYYVITLQKLWQCRTARYYVIIVVECQWIYKNRFLSRPNR